MAAMFTKAKNNHVKNSSFTINNTANFNADSGQALDILYNSVAPNAILNAGGRVDEVRCHPGTRIDVIGLINKWRLDIQNNVKANQMFWLSGPAGAGKTAIVQTLAEDWKAAGVHTANFFFFRTDPSRSHAKSFVSTLLYQIFDFFPAARGAAGRVLGLKPRIFDAGLEDQVDELLCTAFRSTKPAFSQKIVFLIDGLDECDTEVKTSQRQILHILDKLVNQEDSPFLVLVASRAEPQISAAFKQLTSQARSVFLDGRFFPERDIRRFVSAEFRKIQKSHLHSDFLPSNWPSDSEVDAIVRKSSGQFIYAATVMRFLAQSSAVPSLSLEKVHNIVACAKNSPFTHLDAFYTYILQQADDVKAVHDVLSAALLDECTPADDGEAYLPLLSKEEVESRQIGYAPMYFWPEFEGHGLPPINEFLRLYDSRYTEPLFISCISDISSIVQVHEGRLKFYHASLSDFLLDQSRSDLLHVSIGEFAAKVLPSVWNHTVYSQSRHRGYSDVLLGTKLLDLVQHTTPAITHALLTVHPSDLHAFKLCFKYSNFQGNILRLYYDDDIGTYNQILEHAQRVLSRKTAK